MPFFRKHIAIAKGPKSLTKGTKLAPSLPAIDCMPPWGIVAKIRMIKRATKEYKPILFFEKVKAPANKIKISRTISLIRILVSHPKYLLFWILIQLETMVNATQTIDSPRKNLAAPLMSREAFSIFANCGTRGYYAFYKGCVKRAESVFFTLACLRKVFLNKKKGAPI